MATVAIAVGVATAVKGVEDGGSTAVGAARLEPLAEEEEERHTLSLKAHPPWVFTMPEPEKENKLRKK